MNLSAKKFLGASLTLALAAMNLAAQSAAPFGNLPLWFEAGQPAKFVAHASGSEFAITATGAEFNLAKINGETAGGQLHFVDANPNARITGDQPLVGTINYLLGSNPGGWRSGVPTFAQVRVENIYPGVNVVYYGSRQQLEYDFDLAAGVNPSAIALRFDRAEKISVNPQGELVIRFHSGEVVQHAPVAYQTIRGARQEITAGYKMLDAHTAAFALGNYDRSEPMVIDPVLSFSTYFGGNYGESGWAIAVNTNDGSIYVAGQTYSTKFTNIISSGAFQTSYHGGKLSGDAFVARFDASGTNLIYATYLGGSGNDGALGLAVDAAGNAYVTGFTDSTNFPTQNALYSHVGGSVDKFAKSHLTDAFVTELNPAGTGLVYSTYLGGDSMDAAYGIALDGAGDAFVTGYTYSTNFPVTANAFQPHPACPNTVYINANAFVAELSTGGTNLNYSTYLGGTNFDVGRAIAVNNGMVFVAGHTVSTNFPNINGLAGFGWLNGTTNKFNPLHSADAFVAAFTNSALTNLTLLYSTILGASNMDVATGIAAGPDGTAYVAGYTSSKNFPNTATNVPGLTTGYGTNKTVSVLITNAFLTQIKWNGTNAALGYSAVFGGKDFNTANGVALDPAGDAFVVGTTTSTNFPVTTNDLSQFLTRTNNTKKGVRTSDVFVIAFNTNASALLFSSYLGGNGNDFGNAIAVYAPATNVCNAYVVGQTLSTNFPTRNALQIHRTGTNDMFIAELIFTNLPAVPNVVQSPMPALLIAPEYVSAPAVQANIAGPRPSPQPGMALTWQMPATGSNYDVESSPDLTPNSWRIVSAIPTCSNGWYHVTLPATNGIQFFRLRQH